MKGGGGGGGEGGGEGTCSSCRVTLTAVSMNCFCRFPVSAGFQLRSQMIEYFVGTPLSFFDHLVLLF